MTARKWWTLIISMFVGIAVAGGTLDTTRLAGFAIITVVALVVHIFLHELGHAIVGVLVGFRVTQVVTGAGPMLARLRIKGCSVEFRLLPTGGVTRYALRHPDAATEWIRVKFFLSALAGPLATAAVGLFLAPAIPETVGWTTELADGRASFIELQGTLINFSILLVITNLIPFGGRDGHLMVKMMTASDEEIRRLGEAFGAVDTAEKIRDNDIDGAIAAFEAAGNVDNPLVLVNHGAALCLAGRFREARAIILPIIEHDLPHEAAAAGACTLAIACLESGDKDLIWEAEEWLRATDELRGERDPARNFARGLHSLVHGHPDHALEWADVGITFAQRAQDRRQEGLCWMLQARAMAATGRVFDAQRSAEYAMRCDRDSPALLRQRGEIDDACLRHVAGLLGESDRLPDAFRTNAATPMIDAARRAVTNKSPIDAQLLLGAQPADFDRIIGALGLKRTSDDGMITLT